jgi:uncharacterized phiE125 gp8 family phage protein
MTFGLTLVTPPASEPVSDTEAKLHLRVDHTADDSLIDSLITAARRQVETHTGRALVTQTWDMALDGWPCGGEIDIPLPPLQSVTSLTYYDTSSNATVWSSSNYQVVTDGVRGRLVLGYGKTWPAVTLRPAAGIIVRFVAGYGAASAVPEDIKAAIKLWLGHLYANREAVTGTGGVTVGPQVVPMAVDALLAAYRAKRF